MKVKIGNYPQHLTCKIYSNLMIKRHGFLWDVKETWFEKFVDKLEDFIQEIYRVPNFFLDRRSRKIKVRIDPSDTFNMDETMSHILVPMLKQLRENSDVSPNVDNEDVPENLWSSKVGLGDIDENHHLRWDYVLGEMIWAFEQTKKGDWEMEFYKFEDDEESPFGLRISERDDEGMEKYFDRMKNGHRLFGKYYLALWS